MFVQGKGIFSLQSQMFMLRSKGLNLFVTCRFEPKFTVLEKTAVNGNDGHAVFKALKASLPFRNTPVSYEVSMNQKHTPMCELIEVDFFLQESNPFGTQGDGYFKKINYSPFSIADVIWNFEHFLISPDGTPYKRYHPKKSYDEIPADIESILA
jgi:glutathione peroxidase-family protein